MFGFTWLLSVIKSIAVNERAHRKEQLCLSIPIWEDADKGYLKVLVSSKLNARDFQREPGTLLRKSVIRVELRNKHECLFVPLTPWGRHQGPYPQSWLQFLRDLMMPTIARILLWFMDLRNRRSREEK